MNTTINAKDIDRARNAVDEARRAEIATEKAYDAARVSF